MSNRFLGKLTALLDAGRAPLCVGLDPNPQRKPARYPDLLSWNQAIIEATVEVAACYKPNIAFYEALGREAAAGRPTSPGAKETAGRDA